jgi:hypothetical protein
MPVLRLIPSQTKEKLQISQRAPDHLNVKARRGKRTVVEFPAFRPTSLKSDDSCRPCASGEFLRGLSITARNEFGIVLDRRIRKQVTITRGIRDLNHGRAGSGGANEAGQSLFCFRRRTNHRSGQDRSRRS